MTEPAELSCKELIEIVTDYLDGALAHGERRRFEAHLTECEGCRIYLDQIRRTIELAGTLTEETIPPAARERLLEAFRGWRDG